MKNDKILILKRGDELISKIVDYCGKNKIQSGWFYGIGAAKSAKLGFYDLRKKEYIFKELTDNYEITNISGNITMKESEIIIHCHASLSDINMNSFGGHVQELIVSGTCEILIKKCEKKMIRKYNIITGLNLIEN